MLPRSPSNAPSRRGHFAFGLALALLAAASAAPAQPAAPASSASNAPLASSAGPPATPMLGFRGVAVLATDGATDAAWPLAQALYADPRLRPRSLDDGAARVLAGERLPEGAPPRLREIAELRAAIHGTDLPSRRLLEGLARDLGVSAVAVVSSSPSPSCAVFLGSRGQFDPVPLPADPPGSPGGPVAWKGALASLRALAPEPAAPAASGAPLIGPRARPGPEQPSGTTFLTSGWFWGALLAAAALGTTVFLVTRHGADPSTNVPLQGRVIR